MPDPKKKFYTPYGSDKINIDDKGEASPKPYNKTRTMGVDKKTGKKTINITRNDTKKLLFSGNDEISSGKDSSGRIAPKGATESNRFVNDSINYANNANYQAEKFNIGRAASNGTNTNATQNAMAFVGKKKK